MKNILIGVLIFICCLSLFYASIKASEADGERQRAVELQELVEEYTEKVKILTQQATEAAASARIAEAEALIHKEIAENTKAQLMKCQNR